jgi:hypothetical protein
MDDVVAWEYRHETLKVARDGTIKSDLTDLGRNGWELIRILPLPEADEPGLIYATIAVMVLRRPLDRRYEICYETIKVERNVGARFTFGSRDKDGLTGPSAYRFSAAGGDIQPSQRPVTVDPSQMSPEADATPGLHCIGHDSRCDGTREK